MQAFLPTTFELETRFALDDCVVICNDAPYNKGGCKMNRLSLTTCNETHLSWVENAYVAQLVPLDCYFKLEVGMQTQG
jgi:hypothetical protein